MKSDFQNGKYFVSDQVIGSVGEDFFGHNDFALTIENIIKTQPIPHNIALVGEWGLGKSSIIELVKSRLHGHSCRGNQFHVIEINAWKYEKEIFQRVFLKKAWNALGGEDGETGEELLKKLAIMQANEDNKSEEKNFLDSCKDVFENISKLLLKAAVLAIFIFIVSYTFSCFFPDQAATVLKDKLYITPIITLVISLAYDFIKAFEKKKSRAYNIVMPVKFSDEYEALLRTKLPDNGNTVLVVIIDDIDRLGSTKMIEALDALKAFSSFNKCVFIVPFDDSKIKKAYKDAKCTDDEYIACELMLDKLFQYRLALPPLVKKDLIPYANRLVDTQAPDLRDQINEIAANFFEETILPILVPTHITTPRTLKKIINCFATNYLLIKSRSEVDTVEISNKLHFEMDSKTIQTIAMLSVVQSEFSNIYENLLQYPTIMQDTIDDYENESKDEDENKVVTDNSYLNLRKDLLKDSELLGFLSRSKHLIKINREILFPMLYMSESMTALKSNGLYYEIHTALSNGNTIEALPLIKEIENNVAYLKDELLNGGLHPAVERQYIVSICGLFSDLVGDKKALANLLVTRILVAQDISSFSEAESIHIIDALNVYLEADSRQKTDYAKWLAAKLHVISLKVTDGGDIENISEIINFVINEKQNLDSVIVETLRKFISRIPTIDKDMYDLRDFIDGLDPTYDKTQTLLEYFPNDVLKRVSKLAAEEVEDAGAIMQTIIALTEQYIENEKYTELCAELYVAMQSYTSFMAVKDCILHVKNKFTNESLNLFVEGVSQIKRTKDNTSVILSFISELSCEYTESTIAELDAVLSSSILFKEIDNIVFEISSQGMLADLTTTISTLNENIFEKSGKHNLFSRIFENYSDEQKAQFTSLFANGVAATQDDAAISKVCSIVEQCQNKLLLSEWLAAYLDSIVSNFSSYYTYEKWAKCAVVILGNLERGISPSYKTNYYSYLQTAFPNVPAVCLKAWSYLPTEGETESQTNFIVTSSLALSKANAEDVFRVISRRKETCKEVDLNGYFLWLYCGLADKAIFDEVFACIEAVDELQEIDSLFSRACEVDKDKSTEITKLIVEHLKSLEDIEKPLKTILFNSTCFDAGLFTTVISETGFSASAFYKSIIEEMNTAEEVTNIERIIQVSLIQKPMDIESIIHAVGLLASKGDKIHIDEIFNSLEQIKQIIKRRKNVKAQFIGYLEIMVKSISDEEQKGKIKSLLNP